MEAFKCTSIQRQFKDKMGSKTLYWIVTALSLLIIYNINKNNDNTNKVIIIMKVEQLIGISI